MVSKIHSMKKEKITQKIKDQVLWEDFVVKNNIKKKLLVTTELIREL